METQIAHLDVVHRRCDRRHQLDAGSGNVGKLAACMWNNTQAAICNGQPNIEEFRNQNMNSVIEAVNWSYSRVLPNRKWVSEISLMMHEHDILERLKLDVDVPCVVQWGLLGVPPHKGEFAWVHERRNAGYVQFSF